jgi:predicted nucleic acid-binding protein
VIAVDTSVWVSALRRRAGDTTAPVLNRLLDADDVVLPLPVRIELLAGVARSARDELKRSLAALPVVVPTDQTWSLVQAWTESAANAGFRLGLTDLLIAALAEEVGALVWSLDADFQQLAALNLVRLYA